MKFSVGWLKDHLETNASVDEIADALTDLGLEVESIINPSERLKHFKVGEILAAEKSYDFLDIDKKIFLE